MYACTLIRQNAVSLSPIKFTSTRTTAERQGEGRPTRTVFLCTRSEYTVHEYTVPGTLYNSARLHDGDTLVQ